MEFHRITDSHRVNSDGRYPLPGLVGNFRRRCAFYWRHERGNITNDSATTGPRRFAEPRGIPVVGVAAFAERRFGRVDLGTVDLDILLNAEGYSGSQCKRASKRLLDIAGSIVLAALLLPLMVLAALALMVELKGRGPVLYSQLRVGEHGRHYTLFKFRSMRSDAEAGGDAQYAQQGDERVTAVGCFLPTYRIDELPQLVNVLRGEMSLVGPRPERPQFVESHLAAIPFYGLRHEVKPGITGWAQISHPYGACADDAIRKLEYDLYCVKNFGTWLDLTVLSQRVHIVLFGAGAR